MGIIPETAKCSANILAKLGGVCLCISLMIKSAPAADCGAKVKAAFQMLQTSGRAYRVESLVFSGDQQTGSEIFEFAPPDRMRVAFRTSGKEDEPVLEWVRVGVRVWDRVKGRGWSETAGELADAFGRLGVFDRHQMEEVRWENFECLGPMKFSDKTLIGYRAHQERSFWRTVLVDGETGLLAYEIATPEKQLDKLKWRKQYTYPTDIAINPPHQ